MLMQEPSSQSPSAVSQAASSSAVLNVRYCDDDPGTVKDLQAIENWMNNQESGEGLAKVNLMSNVTSNQVIE